MAVPDSPHNEQHTPGKSPSQSGFTPAQRILLAIVPPLATLLIRALCSTLRFQTVTEARAHPADETPGPDLYVFWHRSLLMAAYRYRNLGIRILISASFDGELIARIVARLGFVPVRGSSSRGGATGLIGITRALHAGNKVAITADGPRGPIYIAKPGTVATAQRSVALAQRSVVLATRARSRPPTPPINPTEGNISPFHLHPERAWTLRSWDRFLIPKPFTRVRCAWVTPLSVSADEPSDVANQRLQFALDRAVQLAEMRP